MQRHLLEIEDKTLRIEFDMTNQGDRYRYKKIFGNTEIKRRSKRKRRKSDKWQRKIHKFFYTLTHRGKLKKASTFKIVR